MNENEILYVPGKEWRRHDPNMALLQPMKPPVPAAVIAYTLRDPCFNHQECLREIKWTQKCHTFGLKMGDIRYSFLIGGDAAVYECRGWTSRPALPVKYSFTFTDYVYIAFMGRFIDEPPGEKMMEALRWLLNQGVEKNYLSKDYKEISLENRMPPTGTGHRVESIGQFIQQDGTGNYEPHKHVNTGEAEAHNSGGARTFASGGRNTFRRFNRPHRPMRSGYGSDF